MSRSAQTIHHRHHPIENHEIGPKFLGFGKRFKTTLDLDDFPRSGALQQATQGSSHRRIVFGNQYSRHAIGHASRDGWALSVDSSPHQGLTPYEGTMNRAV